MICGRKWCKVVNLKGEYNHTTDDKGRIIVPVKLRETLGESFVITKGLDGCLWMFDMSEWEKIEEQIRNMPFTLKEARLLSRFILAGAYDCEPDKQGRMLIPPQLRDYADIKKDVVFAGVGNKVEVWSKEKYEDASSFENMDEIAEKLIDLGFRL